MRIVSMGGLVERLENRFGDTDPFVQRIRRAVELAMAGDDDAGAAEVTRAMDLLDTYSEADRVERFEEMNNWLFGGDGSSDAAGLADMPVQGNA